MISELITDVKALAASIRRGSAVNVNDRFSKDRSIDLATQYFNDVKPLVLSIGGATEEVRHHDELWQQLVQLAHGNNQRQTYVKILGLLRKELSAFNVAALTAPGAKSSAISAGTPTFEENLIITTLESLVPSAAASYRQAVSDLSKTDRVSFRGTAAEFRESLRETLDHLAPDADVEAQPWFKLEEKQTKPTMKQKTRYVLTSRGRPKTQRATAEKTAALVEELSGEVMRAVYDRASLATHVETSKQEVARVKRYVDTLLFDFLEISS
jgi:Predicted pPIWI-associating nuclease